MASAAAASPAAPALPPSHSHCGTWVGSGAERGCRRNERGGGAAWRANVAQGVLVAPSTPTPRAGKSMRGGASWRGVLWTVLQQTRPLAPLLPQQRHARGGTVPPPYLHLHYTHVLRLGLLPTV